MEPSPPVAPDGLLHCSQRAMIAVYLPVVVYSFIGLDILTDGYLLPAVERLCEWIGSGTAVTDLIFLKVASQSAMIVAMVAWAVWDGDLAVVDFTVDGAIFGLLVNVGLAGLSSPVPIQLACPPLVRNALFAALIVGTAAAAVYAPFPDAGVGSWWEGLVLLSLFGTFVAFVVFANEPFLAVCARFWPPSPPLAAAAASGSLVRVTVDGDGRAGQDWGRTDSDGSPLEQTTDVPPSFPSSLSGFVPTVAPAMAVRFSDGELGRAGSPAGDTLRAQSLPLPALRATSRGGSVAFVDGEQEEPIGQDEAQAVASLGQRAQAADAGSSPQAGHHGRSTPKASAAASNEAGAGSDLTHASRSDSSLVRTRSRRLRSARSTAVDAAADVSGAAVTTMDRSDDSTKPPPRCLTALSLDSLVTVAGRLWGVVCLPWELLFRCTVIPCADDRNRHLWPLTLIQSILWVVAIIVPEMFVEALVFACAHPLGDLQWKLLAIGYNASEAVAAYQAAKHGQATGVLVDALGDTIIGAGAGLGVAVLLGSAFHHGRVGIATSVSDTEAWGLLAATGAVQLAVFGVGGVRVGKLAGGLLLVVYAAHLAFGIAWEVRSL